MHVLFLEPAFPRNQREFVRALRTVGAQVTAIGEGSVDSLDPELKSWLHGYEQVGSVVDESALTTAVHRVQSRHPVDRLEVAVEAHVMAAAHVREACGIAGTTARTAWLCRDKPAMKQVLREAGIPCAQSTGAQSAAEVRTFAANVGYPLIVKPSDAAGASGATKVMDAEDLEHAIHVSGVGRGRPCAVEEFIEGHEGFYDTLCCDGRIVHDFACHYYPNVLEAMRTRWISPQIVTTNRLDQDGYHELKELGAKVIAALGIWTSATHMEWFFGPKGLKFSEIGCRPPGVRVWDLYAAANEFDIYAEWAKLIVHGRTDRRPSRGYAAGMIALRPDRDGRIVRYEGLEEIQRLFGPHILDTHLPPAGTPTQGIEAGYMANAWIRMRHRDYDELRGMLDRVGQIVRVRAG